MKAAELLRERVEEDQKTGDALKIEEGQHHCVLSLEVSNCKEFYEKIVLDEISKAQCFCSSKEIGQDSGVCNCLEEVQHTSRQIRDLNLSSEILISQRIEVST